MHKDKGHRTKSEEYKRPRKPVMELFDVFLHACNSSRRHVLFIFPPRSEVAFWKALMIFTSFHSADNPLNNSQHWKIILFFLFRCRCSRCYETGLLDELFSKLPLFFANCEGSPWILQKSFPGGSSGERNLIRLRTCGVRAYPGWRLCWTVPWSRQRAGSSTRWTRRNPARRTRAPTPGSGLQCTPPAWRADQPWCEKKNCCRRGALLLLSRPSSFRFAKCLSSNFCYFFTEAEGWIQESGNTNQCPRRHDFNHAPCQKVDLQVPDPFTIRMSQKITSLKRPVCDPVVVHRFVLCVSEKVNEYQKG